MRRGETRRQADRDGAIATGRQLLRLNPTDQYGVGPVVASLT